MTSDLGGDQADSTGLLTDHYELTMLRAALRSGAAQRRSVFEVFARHLAHGRRYGVVAGTGRVLDAVERFRFGPAELDFLQRSGVAAVPLNIGSGVRQNSAIAYLTENVRRRPNLTVRGGTGIDRVLVRFCESTPL